MRTKTAAGMAHTCERSAPGRPWERLSLYLSIFALTVLLTSLLWRRPGALTTSLALVSALLLWRWHSRAEVAYFALSTFLGPMGELVAVRFGAWEYSLPLVILPIWLPLAYGISGLFLYKIVNLILQLHPKSTCGLPVEPARLCARKGATDPLC